MNIQINVIDFHLRDQSKQYPLTMRHTNANSAMDTV